MQMSMQAEGQLSAQVLQTPPRRMVDDVKEGKKALAGKTGGKSAGKTAAKKTILGKRTVGSKTDDSRGEADGAEPGEEYLEVEGDGATTVWAVVGSRKRKPAPDVAGPARRKMPRRG
ncbi:hypothetical protein LTR78_006001 [Recurvomyces mirabilis]|uniref:Uncharacterized protein n=1 Tax=Recurvomyces mirabilis TaxID=574656 RepID=A0AAE1C0W6_9PEZI|nr:hypothetical protein LTR78_006001 [Recurvomyces mirabilis]